ncbi:hypothetical protein AAMO2058_000903600 [Amorphochlora amoebiformis]
MSIAVRKGDILAVYAGTESEDGEVFWVFEVTRGTSGRSKREVSGIYYTLPEGGLRPPKISEIEYSRNLNNTDKVTLDVLLYEEDKPIRPKVLQKEDGKKATMSGEEYVRIRDIAYSLDGKTDDCKGDDPISLKEIKLMGMKQLRLQLKKRGLGTNGRKSTLVKRLTKALRDEMKEHDPSGKFLAGRKKKKRGREKKKTKNTVPADTHANNEQDQKEHLNTLSAPHPSPVSKSAELTPKTTPLKNSNQNPPPNTPADSEKGKQKHFAMDFRVDSAIHGRLRDIPLLADVPGPTLRITSNVAPQNNQREHGNAQQKLGRNKAEKSSSITSSLKSEPKEVNSKASQVESESALESGVSIKDGKGVAKAEASGESTQLDDTVDKDETPLDSSNRPEVGLAEDTDADAARNFEPEPEPEPEPESEPEQEPEPQEPEPEPEPKPESEPKLKQKKQEPELEPDAEPEPERELDLDLNANSSISVESRAVVQPRRSGFVALDSTEQRSTKSSENPSKPASGVSFINPARNFLGERFIGRGRRHLPGRMNFMPGRRLPPIFPMFRNFGGPVVVPGGAPVHSGGSGQKRPAPESSQISGAPSKMLRTMGIHARGPPALDRFNTPRVYSNPRMISGSLSRGFSDTLSTMATLSSSSSQDVDGKMARYQPPAKSAESLLGENFGLEIISTAKLMFRVADSASWNSICARAFPKVNSPRVKDVVKKGQAFETTEIRRSRDGNVYLKLKNAVGWVFAYDYNDRTFKASSGKRLLEQIEREKSLGSPPFEAMLKLEYKDNSGRTLHALKHDIVLVSKINEQGWCLATNANKEQGWLPRDYLQRISTCENCVFETAVNKNSVHKTSSNTLRISQTTSSPPKPKRTNGDDRKTTTSGSSASRDQKALKGDPSEWTIHNHKGREVKQV